MPQKIHSEQETQSHAHRTHEHFVGQSLASGGIVGGGLLAGLGSSYIASKAIDILQSQGTFPEQDGYSYITSGLVGIVAVQTLYRVIIKLYFPHLKIKNDSDYPDFVTKLVRTK